MKGRFIVRTIMGCILAINTQHITAQSPVEALSSTYVKATGAVAYSATPAPNSGSFTNCASQSSSYSFNNGVNNALRLTNIVANGFNFYVGASAPALIKLRRVDNNKVSGARSIIFLEANVNEATNCPNDQQYNFKSPYQDNMETFLNNNYVNQGTDNIFANNGNGDGNINNIERVDVIFPDGISSSIAAEAGFALFDRGNNNAHDAFRITAITAIDLAGNPTAFGPVRTCNNGNGNSNGNWGHPSVGNGNRELSVYVLRKEANENKLRSSAAINQQLGGVFFSLQDLGVADNQVIYGYALISNDGVANPTSAQLLNIYDQSVYPTNTTEASGGGLDLIAVNTFFKTGTVLKGQEAILKGRWDGKKPLLQWTLKELPINSKAEIQASTEGSHFTTTYQFSVPGTYYAGSYTYEGSGDRYFRLKVTTPTGEVRYSAIVQVEGQHATVQLYPSRIQPTQSVRVKGIQDGIYTAILTSSAGNTYVSNLNVQNGLGQIQPPVAGFAKGFYYVSIKNASSHTEAGAKLVVY